MSAPSLFDFLKAINEPGGDMNLLEADGALKAYSPFMINRGIAQSKMTVLFAQEMNKHVVTDKEMHFAFLFGAIKKSKKYAKWAKKDVADENVQLIQEVYQVNETRAVEFLELLDENDLQFIRASQDKGGRMGRGKQ